MLLIDTYNLIHAGIASGGPFSGLTVRQLCQWIVSSPDRQKTTLVIDGRPKPDEPGPNEFPDLNLVYSGAGITADTVIAQTLERSQNKKKITVITNDRAVQASARRAGARPMSCEAFLQLLVTARSAARTIAKQTLPVRKTHGPNKAETDHWLKEFGVSTDAEKPKPAPKHIDPDNPDIDMKKLMGF